MLINFEHISKSYGERQLLENVTFYLHSGDRLGIVGVNGTGKSTLLKIAARREIPDTGKISYDPNTRISYLPQIPEDDPSRTVLEQVIFGQPKDAREIDVYEAESMLNTLGISDTKLRIGELSGGQRKRISLVQCLICPSDVLILDEPTNHLDMEMIVWLEEFLLHYNGAILFVSHDRYFLENVCTETGDLSFGKLNLCPGGYSSWLDAKTRREGLAAASERKRLSTLRRELIWMLQGPCARGTKSKDRIERYEALRAQNPPEIQEKLSEIRTVSSRLGKKTIELDKISKTYRDIQLIRPFSYTFLRDDRVGIIGKNGSGKSTLLNMISGRLVPDSGTVEIGETVRIGYFTQHSDELDNNLTALEYVKEHGEHIETLDGFLSAEKLMEIFLFPRTLQHKAISKLSGGEKRRLYLLGILAGSPNVLLLDEPTNDLDVPTLQILEEYLITFPGIIVTVSHDRFFLDKICHRVFVVIPGHEIMQFNGGYTDYISLEQLHIKNVITENCSSGSERAQKNYKREHSKKLKFSFKEQREYETIDDDIAKLEEALNNLSVEQELFSTDYIKLQELSEKQQELENKLEQKMERWIYLKDLAEKIETQKTEK